MGARHPSSNFGTLLRRFRRSAELTQEELAERAGLSVRVIQSLEAGEAHRPRHTTVELLADALGLGDGDRRGFHEAARAGFPHSDALSREGRLREPAPSAFGLEDVLSTAVQHLPAQPTPFVGRQEDLEAVRSLVLNPHVRLLTLTGPAGVGKTRLALEVAACIADSFVDGVYFVPLAAVSEPDAAIVAVGRGLGAAETGEIPVAARLMEMLRAKRLLLVLDNFEQILDAAPVVAELLAACPRVKVLVTSREVLHLAAEHDFVVPPLQLPDQREAPDVDGLSQYDAVALFIQRARAARTTFAVDESGAHAIVEICRRLDGLPLAIELAAAWVRMLSPEAILERLNGGGRTGLLTGGPRDSPARHRTLHDAIDWSFRLLDPSEQLIFACLAVFEGGCTLEAAEVVCAVDGDWEHGVLSGLASLVAKSLLTPAPPADGELRFRMLETVRGYAAEKLEVSGYRDAVQQQFARYFLMLAERLESKLKGPEQTMVLARLAEEHDNLRAALRYALSQGDTETALRLSGALTGFWSARSYLTEGRRLLGQVLASPGIDMVDPRLQARVIEAAAGLAIRQGDFDEAEALAECSLDLYRQVDDTVGVARSLNSLGQIATDLGDHRRAVELHEESLVLRRSIGDTLGIATSLNNLGHLALLAAEWQRAMWLLEESMAMAEEAGNVQSVAVALDNLGDAALLRGDFSEAFEAHQRSLELFQELGQSWGVGVALVALGDVARFQRQYDHAADHYAESLGRAREVGDRGTVVLSLAGLSAVSHAWGDLTEAAILAEQSVALARDLGNKRRTAVALWNLADVRREQGMAQRAAQCYLRSLMLMRESGDRRWMTSVLEGLAGVAADTGDVARVARLFGAAEALRETLQIPRPPSEEPAYDLSQARLRSIAEPRAVERVWDEGRAMSLDRVLRYVFEDLIEV